MSMSQELRDLPRQSSRALCGEGEGEADRENDEDNIRDWTGFRTERRREESRGMANVGCQVVWCPKVPKTTGKIVR